MNPNESEKREEPIGYDTGISFSISISLTELLILAGAAAAYRIFFSK